MSSVVDLGAGADPDPRADVTVDQVDLPSVDIVHDLEEQPWPFDDNSVDQLVARHVIEHLESPEEAFSEAARVLIDGGEFEVRVPIGVDAKTDPTHEHEWTWETPEYFTADTPYDYGWGLPFKLVDREVDVWYNGPAADAGNRFLQWLLERSGPGKWLSSAPGISGELIATFRRCPR